MENKKQPITANELIKILQEVPPDTDIYVDGCVIWEHGFVFVDFPITSVHPLKKYTDTNQTYIELYGKRKEREE